MKKILVIGISLLVLLLSVAGCAATPDTSEPEQPPLRVYAIAGPTGVGMVPLMADTGGKYDFTVVTDPSQAVAAIVNGSADVAAVPTNLAATLYKKTNGNVQVLAGNTLGVLYLLENGDTVHTVADLKGKTIYTAGQAANPEYVLRYVLEKNGLNPDKDVQIQFVEDNDTLSTLVTGGKAGIALVPEPKATACRMQNADLRVALDMTQAWDAVAQDNSRLMMGCVVVRRDFVQASVSNQQAIDRFLREYRASIDRVLQDVPTAAEQCVTYGIIPKAPLAVASIPRCQLTFITGDALKTELAGYLNVLYSYNPSAVGGTLPKEDFYYAG